MSGAGRSLFSGLGAMSDTTWREEAVTFECEGCRLVGIITRPAHATDSGVIIVVGGPQYRAGSHRQFTLLARQLGAHGIASIRFDYRGMGDSEGEFRNFEAVDADIRAAIDTLQSKLPDLRHFTLWGLCDAASAALYYGQTDPRVNALVLLNPWVHHEALAAKARLKHYYLARFLQKSFWSKLFSGGISLRDSLGGLLRSARSVAPGETGTADQAAPIDPRHGSAGYIERMLGGLRQFRGHILILLSGDDLVAQEFGMLMHQDKRWKKACHSPLIEIQTLESANHTFSSAPWREWVGMRTAGCIEKKQ